MCSYSYLQLQLCAVTAMCSYSYVQLQLFAATAMCSYSYVQLQLCAATAMCSYSYVQLQLCAVTAMCSYSYVQLQLCAATAMFICFLYSWTVKPDDGCIVQAKRVACWLTIINCCVCVCVCVCVCGRCVLLLQNMPISHYVDEYSAMCAPSFRSWIYMHSLKDFMVKFAAHK